ncbi:uncharacterized protein PHACADRAFT_32060 [Phanerochaete carnosa HHB-10118-sp]|uniref:Uncharacterized protein n=1 Tax=Phanerochaete carnosa (strain HHB-10118-sp) TaxID=650164 RepID=K5WL58_PHACS|nr:uncharacterized protein PHACADRAFT_32060 [Phanerochaete carnosa HHB-10118-sp]EKM51017.1 hypothetical protein PHACADRAFT_32060 [Phanerochaete carnosa HHB-10118-sp]
MTSLKPFSGPLRKLVLAFDVGTTYSGIGYAILDPGEAPKIQCVTRFPGQENGDFKIPSVLWYTQEGKVRAAGVEARDPGMTLIAEDEDLIFVDWFKLHLRPGAMQSEGLHAADIKPLPLGKTVIEVFGDFLAYLFNCAKRHPNGWEGSQQGKMQQAAVYAGLIPDTSAGHARLHFVTEGEASLLYCMDNGLASDAIRADSTVMIIDAGGGTVDLSTYKFATINPVSAEEIAPPDCTLGIISTAIQTDAPRLGILHGSTRVNMLASEFLKARHLTLHLAKLCNSKYGNEEDLKTMLESFERSTKPTFKDPSDRSFIKFGSMRDRDPDVGIRGGQLTLEGAEIANFFEPSITAIANAVRVQRSAATEVVKTGFLVGGFAASPWLYARLKAVSRDLGMDLSRPDSHANKAVAEGAVSFFLTHSIAARMSRLTYGTKCVTRYDPNDIEHIRRHHRIFTRPSGNQIVPDVFRALLTKGTRLTEDAEFRCSLFREATESFHLDNISAIITVYRGKDKCPRWVDTEPGASVAQRALPCHISSPATEFFSQICTVYADTSRVLKKKRNGPKGAYYTQDYDVVILCGATELQAQIRWFENGMERR